jgi:hypothetical protein
MPGDRGGTGVEQGGLNMYSLLTLFGVIPAPQAG